MSADFHCLDANRLQAFLERRRAVPGHQPEMSLADNLVEVLRKAAEFVPAEAGSILLDNPVEKLPDRRQNTLTFIAAFGEASEHLLGKRIPSDRGIAGHVYLTGSAYSAPDVREDSFFYSEIDGTGTRRNLWSPSPSASAPRCAVLELINRRRREFPSRIATRSRSSPATSRCRSRTCSTAGTRSRSLRATTSPASTATAAHLPGTGDRRLHRADAIRSFFSISTLFQTGERHPRSPRRQPGAARNGRLVRKQIGEIRAIAARYGGDEFVLTLPGMGLAAAVGQAEQIRKQIVGSVFCSEPGEIQLEPLSLTGLTCSIGVASLKRHLQKGMTLQQSKSALLRLSDTAMYIAKETGRNQTAVAGKAVRRAEPIALDPVSGR